MKWICTFICLVSFLTSWGQYKFEREYSVKESQVPGTARDFMLIAFPNHKVKWYKEIGLTDTTFEAKTKSKGQLHSIEFGQDGVLLDVEVEIKWNALSKTVQNTAKESLENRWTKYEIDKVQAQYLTTKELVDSYLKAPKKLESPTGYEIILCTKEGGEFRRYEVQLDATGVMASASKIIEKSTDVIDY